MTSGVPQGSILGPTLFILFVNDLPESLNCESVMFADDTSLLVKAPNLILLEREVKRSLSSLTAWFDSNGLTLHPSKTVMNIHGKTAPDFQVSLNGHALKEREDTGHALLGVQISKNLCWKSQIDHVIDKIKSSVNCLSRSRKYLSLQGRLNFFYSFIHSQLTYCLPIWGCEGVKNPDLQKLYKKAIRLVKNKKGAVHTSKMCKELNILPLADLYEHSLWCVAHKYFNSGEYETLFCTRGRNASKNQMKVPLVSSKRQAIHELARAWNSIPKELTEHFRSPFKVFSKQGKKYLLSQIGGLDCTNPRCFECQKSKQ